MESLNTTIAFWSILEHHALALRPIYDKMKVQGKDVVALFNHPKKELLPYSCIVTGTASNIPQAKRLNTIYHFHSLAPHHASPREADYKWVPFFKGVMFPGEWWVDKWPKKPEHWAVVGWSKNDLLQPRTDSEPTVLYASSMFNRQRMKTLRSLISLSRKMSFKLIVKPHYGIKAWFPQQLKDMAALVHLEESAADIAAYFHLADALVSESSGTLWEFMATGRPSIQMKQGEDRGRRIYPGGLLRATFETLEATLRTTFETPEVISSEIALWRERIMGELDGKATDRAIAFIEKVFNE